MNQKLPADFYAPATGMGRPRREELARGFRGLRIDIEHDFANPDGVELLIDAGDIRIEVSIHDRRVPIKIAPEEQALSLMIASVLRNLGVSLRILTSPEGRIAVWALAKHAIAGVQKPSRAIGDGQQAFHVPQCRTLLPGAEIRTC